MENNRPPPMLIGFPIVINLSFLIIERQSDYTLNRAKMKLEK